MRRSNNPLFNCAKLTCSYFESTRQTLRYRVWRYFNSVSTATRRHSIPLPLSPLLASFLRHTIPPLRPFLEAALPADSPIVELSAVISLPGAAEQTVHSDVPFSGAAPALLSVFVALAPVRLPNGPTCLFPGTHSRAFHRRARVAAPAVYASDGAPDVIAHADLFAGEEDPPAETAAAAEAAARPAEYAQLDPGAPPPAGPPRRAPRARRCAVSNAQRGDVREDVPSLAKAHGRSRRTAAPPGPAAGPGSA